MEEMNYRDEGNNAQSNKLLDRSKILLAIIEHSSRPFAYIFICIIISIWLFSAKDVIKVARFGSFEVEMKDVAEKANLSKEFSALSKLSNDQLELFLIVGREREGIVYNGREVNELNLKALKDVGLLTEYGMLPDGKTIRWVVSENGYRLHAIIFNMLLSEIRRSAM